MHHVPQSRSMRTLWLLHELGVEFELVERPFDGSLRNPDYLALSPAGRVPSLELDGVSIIETGAIAEILCERFSPDDLGRRPGHPDRVDWLIWVHFAETISQHAAALTQQHVVIYEDAMRSPIVMKIEAKRLGKCYDAVERRLAGRAYLVGDAFTAADIGVGQAIYMARHFARIDDYPRVSDWYARITDRPAFSASLPGETRLYSQEFYEPWQT